MENLTRSSSIGNLVKEKSFTRLNSTNNLHSFIDWDELEVPAPIEDINFEELKEYWKEEKNVIKKIASEKIEIFKQLNKNPPFAQTLDKLSFTLGILNVGLTTFLVGKVPHLFFWVYTFKLPLLILLRYYLYYKQKFHYFLLDFCYFVNVLFFVYLHFFPYSCSLWKVCFSLMNPLIFAIIAWKNSMVFHSLDKTTSVFIHLTPNLVIWCLRWYPSPDYPFNICQDEGDYISFFDASVFPLVVYLFWQLIYIIKVDVIDRTKFEKDSQYMSSYRWLIESPHNRGLIFHVARSLGRGNLKIGFILAQLLYTFITILPVKLLYQSYFLHTVYLLLMCVICCWNGACFYIDVWSIRYRQSLLELQKEWEDISKALQEKK